MREGECVCDVVRGSKLMSVSDIVRHDKCEWRLERV